ncbi:hypothetical protein AB0J66_05365 [Actinoplanes sp. NPDC049598]|uniref:hypothetical protein n=1 Tax=Actinoplanes sp. NPDC049598 TaxID=3154626 RepID=UPI0034399DF6
MTAAVTFGVLGAATFLGDTYATQATCDEISGIGVAGEGYDSVKADFGRHAPLILLHRDLRHAVQDLAADEKKRQTAGSAALDDDIEISARVAQDECGLPVVGVLFAGEEASITPAKAVVLPVVTPSVGAPASQPTPTRKPTPSSAPAEAGRTPKPAVSRTPSTIVTPAPPPKDVISPAELADAEAAVMEAEDEYRQGQVEGRYAYEINILAYKLEAAKVYLADLQSGHHNLEHPDLDIMQAEVYLEAAKVQSRRAFADPTASLADKKRAQAEELRWQERLDLLQG